MFIPSWSNASFTESSESYSENFNPILLLDMQQFGNKNISRSLWSYYIYFKSILKNKNANFIKRSNSSVFFLEFSINEGIFWKRSQCQWTLGVMSRQWNWNESLLCNDRIIYNVFRLGLIFFLDFSGFQVSILRIKCCTFMYLVWRPLAVGGKTRGNHDQVNHIESTGK